MITYYFGDRCIGKSALLIEMAEKEASPSILQPSVHWIDDGKVWSRNGKELPCITFGHNDSLEPLIKGYDKVYIDEVMMLSEKQLDELQKSSTECICFGLFSTAVKDRARLSIKLD